MKKLPAMNYELDVLKIKVLVEALKIYKEYNITTIPKEFQEIFFLGEKINILMNEMEHTSK